MEINQQSILKSFYLFDKNKLFLAERPGLDRITQRKALAAEWMDAFCTLPANIWEDATDLAIKKSKSWPTVEQMWQYINDSMEPAPAESEPIPPPVEVVKKTPAKESTSSRMKRMLELAKSGNFAAARDSVGHDLTAERDTYIKERWPDAFERIKERCQGEVDDLLKQEKICSKCPGIKRCMYHGYREVGYIEKLTGMLCIRMVPCSKRGEDKQ